MHAVEFEVPSFQQEFEQRYQAQGGYVSQRSTVVRELQLGQAVPLAVPVGQHELEQEYQAQVGACASQSATVV